MPGETLKQISDKLNVSELELKQLNKLKSGAPVDRVFMLVPDRGQRMLKAAAPVDQVKLGLLPTKTVDGRTLKIGMAKQHVGKLQWPVDGGRLGSRFGTRGASFHEGVDIAAAEGIPILAAHDGVVAFAGQKLKGYGNMVILKGDGIVTIYAHNKKNRVESGARVRAGAQIADVGETGRATAPHLHFEVRLQDERGKYSAVDPLSFLTIAEADHLG